MIGLPPPRHHGSSTGSPIHSIADNLTYASFRQIRGKGFEMGLKGLTGFEKGLKRV
jgi:hypothetical protein